MKITEKIKGNCSAEIMFTAVVCFIAGLIVGLSASSSKNGVIIGSYNGWYNGWGNSADKKSVNPEDKLKSK